MSAAWREAMLGGQIVMAPPIALELLYSARSPRAFDQLDEALAELRSLPLSDGIARAARSAMRELAHVSSGAHRMPPADYLIGALAAEAGTPVLHYDRHFDRLAPVMGFASVWLAPRGALG